MVIHVSREHREFARYVAELSGEDISSCFQCGVCSSACPVSDEMDLKPSTLVRRVQLGLKDTLDSRAIWVCSSCYTCLARCPRNIDIAKVSEALRQINLRREGDHIRLDDIPFEELTRLPQIALISAMRKKAA
ncbi:MAG: 4Fe-4S dicluster domain-containing protein [Candidatus Ranarchaeia archaeon]